ncbi:uncharacterized protein LOC133803103 [Humulus lupulus]|uniref:uncharacterized protein LOC133803103 n=1 Tax=Humulus lupulus TaxID=3486 RepID=UPI002B40A6EB|nr:uncharacterized protein LOC133803103 [Humulus lupulus]
MSADVARAHGGDAGGDPPPDPTRIPTTCDSGIPIKRKGRGAAIGKDLEERRRKNGKPLEVTFCPRTYKVVGSEHAAFVRLVGTQIKTKVPGHYGSWELVPQQYKDQVLAIIQYYYQIAGREDFLKCLNGIDREMKDRYRNRKTLRHEHFEKYYNGPEDWDKVLNNPTNDVNKEEWKQICQLFTSPQFIARSIKNKENRKKQKYSTTQGTKSLAAVRFEKTNPDLIESWKNYHWKKSKNDFVNDDARQDYEKLKADFELRTQQTSTDASNNDSPSSVDQEEVLQKVLGQRRGHERGVGRKLKGSGSGSRSSSTQHSHFSESRVPPHHSREYIENLENNLQKLTDQVNFLTQYFVPPFRPPNVQMPHVPDSDNTSRASSSQPPAPTHPSMYGAAPSYHMVPPYMYGTTPYPCPIPPSSQPSYPYMYGAGSSTLPPQYPWPMPPPPPQQSQPPQQPQQEDNREEDEATDLGD